MGNKDDERLSNTSEPLPDTHSSFDYLLRTRFLVPLPSHTLIARPSLMASLNAGLQKRVILVSAAAGFGKTTLLSMWVRSFIPDHPPVAWITLDKGDNMPARFWAYVLTALEQCQPGLSTQPLTLLHEEPPAWQSMLTALINALDQSHQQMVLVLDNYEAITEPLLHALISSLIEHLPPTVCFVLATRVDPPFSLARLRARGQIQELRTAQLRFTLEEAAVFLRDVMGLQCPEKEAQEVEARTEGWWAGLQLAALALQGRANPIDLLQELRGSQSSVLEYLVHEVLQQQPERVQSFLLRTSILGRLSASLCDAVLKQQGSSVLLEELVRSNLFLTPLDAQRHWYVYHPLFAEALRSHLKQIAPTDIPNLHLRASRWYAAQHAVSEAVQHALLAQAWPWTIELLEHIPSQSIWSQLRYALLPSWIERLPPEIIRSRPRLCLAEAQALFWTAPADVVKEWLQDAKSAWAALHGQEECAKGVEQARAPEAPSYLLGEIAALQAVITGSFDGDPGVTHVFCQEALTYLGKQKGGAGVQVVFAQALADVALGHFSSAIEKMLAGSALAQAEKDTATAYVLLTRAGWDITMGGRLHRAWELTQHSIQLVQRSDGSLPALVCWPYARQADILREWNRLEEARDLVEQAIQLSEQTETLSLLPLGYTILLRLSLSQGAMEAAAAAYEQMECAWRKMPSSYRFALYSCVDQVRFWLASGEVERARRWVKECEREEPLASPLAREQQKIAQARVHLADSQPDKTLYLLEPLAERAKVADRWYHVLEMWVLQALAYQMRHQQQEALDVLAQAVHFAAPEGYIRRFVDEGAPMFKLLTMLKQYEAQRGPTPYLDTLLSTFDQTSAIPPRHVNGSASLYAPQRMLDPLSKREHEVLQLIANGATNQGIAETLVLSIDTVRHHVSNILSKLEVTNRTQAVAKARTLGLFSNKT